MDDIFKNPKLPKPNRRNPTIPKPKEKKRNVAVSEDVHTRIKILAAQEDMPIQELVTKALEEYEKTLTKRKNKKDL